MSVALSPEVERDVVARVESGQYGSTDEVVRQALVALSEREVWEAKRDALQRELDIGIADADAGRFVETTAAEILAQIRAGRAVATEGVM